MGSLERNPMKKYSTVYLLAAAVVAVLVSVAGAADSRPEDLPKAVAPEPRFVFSTVVEGTVVSHDYVIENHGTAPLNILQVRTG